jgi:hypothetical protein
MRHSQLAKMIGSGHRSENEASTTTNESKGDDRMYEAITEEIQKTIATLLVAERLPIASGIIEGSCRLVVEDRLDRTGMRWCLEGALAMLANRTTSLSDDWNDYQTFRITREQKRLYPTAT